jgi:hypothetical protein
LSRRGSGGRGRKAENDSMPTTTRGGGVPATITRAERAVSRAERDAPALWVLASGLLAGAAGVAAMTLAEKVEQSFTGRPNS